MNEQSHRKPADRPAGAYLAGEQSDTALCALAKEIAWRKWLTNPAFRAACEKHSVQQVVEVGPPTAPRYVYVMFTGTLDGFYRCLRECQGLTPNEIRAMAFSELAPCAGCRGQLEGVIATELAPAKD